VAFAGLVHRLHLWKRFLYSFFYFSILLFVHFDFIFSFFLFLFLFYFIFFYFTFLLFFSLNENQKRSKRNQGDSIGDVFQRTLSLKTRPRRFSFFLLHLKAKQIAMA